MKILNSQPTPPEPPPAAPPRLRKPAPEDPPGGFTIFVLNVVAVLSGIFALFAAAFSKSAIHEIEAGIAVLCFITALSGSAIIQLLRFRRT